MTFAPQFIASEKYADKEALLVSSELTLMKPRTTAGAGRSVIIACVS
jgi:hypothetical protein